MDEQPLRATVSGERADAWALVLAADGIAHRIAAADDGGFVLLVAEGDAPAAEAALAAADREEAEERARPSPVEDRSRFGLAGLVLAAGLAVAYLVAGGAGWSSPGAASAERILDGEWWRAITALTLHGDGVHLAGNLVACALFVGALSGRVGPGVTAWLLLASGAVGNLATALVQRAAFVSVGSSTALFGAVGALGAIELVARRRSSRRGRRAWPAVAASLALLGLLGAGAKADVLAHLFGCIAGFAFGLVAALPPRPPRALAQGLLTAAALAVVAAAWTLARLP